MRAIMISIQPKWVEKILSGEKTIEIRKTKPKCKLPCKVYIYETKGKFVIDKHWVGNRSVNVYQYGLGKVVAEFTLNVVEQYGYFYSPAIFTSEYRKVVNDEFTSDGLDYKKCCMTTADVVKYSNCSDYYLIPAPIYAWYIDDLIIYDKPKELDEFSAYIPNNECYDNCKLCNAYDKEHKTCLACMNLHREIKRPPQSWCYCIRKEEIYERNNI